MTDTYVRTHVHCKNRHMKKFEEEDRVKVHYIGYDSAHDEWKKREELKILNDERHGL